MTVISRDGQANDSLPDIHFFIMYVYQGGTLEEIIWEWKSNKEISFLISSFITITLRSNYLKVLSLLFSAAVCSFV